MQLEEIQPFVRFVRYLYLDEHSPYRAGYPCDARLFYVCSGRGTLWADNQSYQIEKGCALLMHAGIRYQLPSPEGGLRLLAVNFDFTRDAADRELPIPPMWCDEFTPESELAPCTFPELPAFNRILFLTGQFQLESRLQHMEELYRRRQRFFRAELAAELSTILIGFAHTEAAQSGARGAVSHRADPIITWIHAHYAQPLTNAEIGAQFGFHPNYVSSLISEATGMSLHRYLLYIRISNAIDLLETTAMPISAVAQQTGFDDVSYFSKYFRKMTGLCPRNYRSGRV